MSRHLSSSPQFLGWGWYHRHHTATENLVNNSFFFRSPPSLLFSFFFFEIVIFAFSVSPILPLLIFNPLFLLDVRSIRFRCQYRLGQQYSSLYWIGQLIMWDKKPTRTVEERMRLFVMSFVLPERVLIRIIIRYFQHPDRQFRKGEWTAGDAKSKRKKKKKNWQPVGGSSNNWLTVVTGLPWEKMDGLHQIAVPLSSFSFLSFSFLPFLTDFSLSCPLLVVIVFLSAFMLYMGNRRRKGDEGMMR